MLWKSSKFWLEFKCRKILRLTTFKRVYKRRYNLLNSNSFTNKLLFTDRCNFSSEDGSHELKKESFKLPSESWCWKTDWTFEENISDVWEILLYYMIINNYLKKNISVKGLELCRQFQWNILLKVFSFKLCAQKKMV